MEMEMSGGTVRIEVRGSTCAGRRSPSPLPDGVELQRRRGARWAALAAFLACLLSTGCSSGVGGDSTGSGSPLQDGNRDANATSTLGKTSGEPNDAFASAVVAVFSEDGVAELQGTVSATGDLDVYLLGALEPGDGLVVDAATAGSSLDVSVAIFDAEQRLVYNNDDRGGSASRFLDSYVEWIVRNASARYYLVVTNSAFAAPSNVRGTYTVDVERVRGLDVPAPRGQILLLDFDGGTVDSPTLGSVTLQPFDAAAISPAYRGQSDTIKRTIRDVFEENFARFDVTIRTTDDPPPAAGSKFSILYFGGFDRMAFGIAEGVDLYNVECCDDAILFTESFSPSVFSRTPTASELGIAVGNVGSHEAGHLLGLNHTDNDRDLMDDQSAADAFIVDQDFMQAPLSGDIMPIGTQDGPMLLFDALGPR